MCMCAYMRMCIYVCVCGLLTLLLMHPVVSYDGETKPQQGN